MKSYIIPVFLWWVFAFTAVSAQSTDAQNIAHTLKNAGLLAPIKNISPSVIDELFVVVLDNSEPLLITKDARYVIAGAVEANPSPKQPINTQLLKTHQKAGTPVANEYKQALLANTKQLKNMTADSAFYHTNIPHLLWGVSGQGGTTFLISRDGRWFVNGEISHIKNGQFAGLDTDFEWQKNRHVFEMLDQNTLTIYPAKQQKAVVYIVTDINCPYCKKFHAKIGEFNQKGITVKAIGFPIYDESHKPMQQIWCQTDNAKRGALLSAAMKGIRHNPQQNPTCKDTPNPIFINQKRALPLAFTATPAIYRDDGQLFEGDFLSDEFLYFLGLMP